MSLFEPGTDVPDTETLIRRVIEIIGNTRTLPLSSSVKLDNKDEVLELLEDACTRLPEELRQARWMLKERTEYLDKVKREGEEILDAARVRAERMVQRTEIVREAQHKAQTTVETAREDARRLRHEAEDYCDQRLASFEIVLERTLKTVQAGREKLQSVPPPLPGDGESLRVGADGSADGAQTGFFDQDNG